MANHTTRNSSTKLCECGCGNPVRDPKHRFLQGHNSKYPDVTPEERFWKYVTPGPFTDCWDWSGALRNGYGVLRINGKTVYAHRFSYELHNKSLRKGASVLHCCDNRKCCNPYHLFSGTQRDNIQDMYGKGRGKGGAQAGEKHRKLTRQDVKQIRKLVARGVRYPALAEQFNVSVSAICMIVNRKRWKHVK